MLKLVAFDMDGTLVDVSSSWGAVHQHFGLSNAKALEQFLNDEIDDEEFVRADVRLWKTRRPEITIEEVEEILDRVPLMPGASELLKGLRERGVRTAIISGGIDLLARRIGRELGMEYVLANGIRTSADGRLTDEGIIRVPIKRKGEALRSVQRNLGVGTQETASVGNSEIDIAMFRESRVGLAFRPEDEATAPGGHHGHRWPHPRPGSRRPPSGVRGVDGPGRDQQPFGGDPARQPSMESYETLLERARAKLPEVRTGGERFQVPDPDVMSDGKNTVIRNLQPIAEVLRREPAHVIGFLAKELGCPGVLDLPRGVLKSRVSTEAIGQRIREYTEKYVICSECKRPDTHLKKDGRLVTPGLRGVRRPAPRHGAPRDRPGEAESPGRGRRGLPAHRSRTSDAEGTGSRRRKGS